jgi:hypothetical protein
MQKSEEKGIKQQFLEKLKELDALQLPREHYLIWGSGPLAIREIRLARDIDIVVSQELWKSLTQKYAVQGEKKNLIRVGCLEIWNDCLNLTDKIDEMLQAREVIEGYPFMNLRYTIEWKKFWNHEKDKVDLPLIERYLQARNKMP